MSGTEVSPFLILDGMLGPLVCLLCLPSKKKCLLFQFFPFAARMRQPQSSWGSHFPSLTQEIMSGTYLKTRSSILKPLKMRSENGQGTGFGCTPAGALLVPQKQPDGNMRLQSFLSQAGISSRRSVIQELEDGKVKVNGEVVRIPSYPIFPGKDQITYLDQEVTLY